MTTILYNSFTSRIPSLDFISEPYKFDEYQLHFIHQIILTSLQYLVLPKIRTLHSVYSSLPNCLFYTFTYEACPALQNQPLMFSLKKGSRAYTYQKNVKLKETCITCEAGISRLGLKPQEARAHVTGGLIGLQSGVIWLV